MTVVFPPSSVNEASAGVVAKRNCWVSVSDGSSRPSSVRRRIRVSPVPIWDDVAWWSIPNHVKSGPCWS